MTEPEPTYCGMRMTEMTREELIGAVKVLGAMIEDEAKESQRRLNFYAEMLKLRS